MDVRGKSGGAEAAAPDIFDPDEYGCGDYDPETGLYEWYEFPPEVGDGPALTWRDLLSQWALIEADLQEVGVDVESGILADRSARWLRVRILGLFATQSRLWRHFNPPKQQ